MSNPYQSPRALEPVAYGVEVEKLRRVAHYQQWVIFTLLANLVLYVASLWSVGYKHVLGSVDVAELAMVGFAATMFLIWLFSTIAVFRLANELFHVVVAVLCGLLMIVPCIALLTLLVVNQRATSYLQAHGVKVGFLGVSSNSI